jgi:hypothetical protein
MRRYSNRLKGVMIAVFGMSEGLTGTWWYPLTWSIFEKTVQPCKCADMSCMLGSGYLSGVVCMLRRR